MANFTPQEIEQFLQEFFDVVGTRQYVGARYVPIFGRKGESTIDWDNLEPYEPLTVVMHVGVSYVSKQYVPSGVDITDTEYWAETYRFNAQVEQYRQEVLGFQDQIDSIRETMESDYVPFPDPDTYPKYGTLGQVLSTLADGTTMWEDPVVPSDEQAEEVITAWLDDHPEATTTVQDGSITNAKLYADGIIRWNMAMFITAHQTKFTYNPDTFTITLPAGAIWARGRGYGFSAQTIDASAVQLSQAFALFVDSNNQVYASNWNQLTTNSGDPLIGYAYRQFVWLNGVSPELIEVIGNAGADLNMTHLDSFGMYSCESYVTYDFNTKTLTIPQGFGVYRNKIVQVNPQTLDLSSSLVNNTCVLLLNSLGVVTAVPYGSAYEFNTSQPKCAIIGKVQGREIDIYGLSHECIVVTNVGSNSATSTFGYSSHRMAYVGIRDDVMVTYDQNTHVLVLPPGFNYINGCGMGRQETTLDVSSALSSNCCIICVDETNVITAKRWNGASSIDPRLFVLGYIYRNVVYLNGVPASQIMVNKWNTTDIVCCFGDSITAGVGGSKLYHMYWHEWLQSVRFRNYGVGGTGYTVERIGSAESGLGNEGDGTNYEWEGDNTIIQMMQSVSDPMWAITIAAGTNDWSRNTPAATFRTAVAAALDYAQSLTPRVLAITPIRRQRGTEPTTNTEGLTVEDYGDIIIEEAVARGIAYANGYDVAINPANAVSKTAYAPDGLHPNEAGQLRMARSYYNKLLETIGK